MNSIDKAIKAVTNGPSSVFHRDDVINILNILAHSPEFAAAKQAHELTHAKVYAAVSEGLSDFFDLCYIQDIVVFDSAEFSMENNTVKLSRIELNWIDLVGSLSSAATSRICHVIGVEYEKQD